MSYPQILITGCARSGTGYLHAVLNQIGINTGHERVFNPFSQTIQWGKLEAESSWLAAPWLSKLPPDTVVVHLHRHPCKVIKSHLDLLFFENQPPNYHLPYLAVAKSVIADYDRHTPAERAELYWYGWNRLVMNQLDRFEHVLEVSLPHIDVAFLHQLLRRSGRNVSPARLLDALSYVSHDYNHKRDSKPVDHPMVPLQYPATQKLAEYFDYRHPLVG